MLQPDIKIDNVRLLDNRTYKEKLKECIVNNLNKYNLDPKLTILLLFVIFLESLSSVFFKRWTSQMSNYIWFTGTMLSTLLFAIIIWLYILLLVLFKKAPIQKYIFTPKIIIISALLDTLSSLLGTYSSPYLSVGIQAILKQWCLVMTIIFSIIFLKKKYQYSHYLASFLIIYAIIVSLLPELHDSGNNVINPAWAFIFLIQYLPAAGSNVYKEYQLKDVNISATWLNANIVLCQLLLGLLTLPIIFIQLPAPAQTIPINDFGNYLRDSFSCLAGYNIRNGDNCENAMVFFLIQTFLNVGFNIVLLKIFRHGSASMYMIFGSFRIILTAILGTSSILQGSDYVTHLDFEFVLSMIMIVVGIIVYSWNKENDNKEILENPLLNEKYNYEGIIETEMLNTDVIPN